MNKAKEHDIIMNSLDWSLENSTGLSWLELSDTVEYKEISSAVWRLVHGEHTSIREDDE
jgi:dihydroneopterin aldolase